MLTKRLGSDVSVLFQINVLVLCIGLLIVPALSGLQRKEAGERAKRIHTNLEVLGMPQICQEALEGI